jgi:quinohemoprotein amine dehydrogenase
MILNLPPIRAGALARQLFCGLLFAWMLCAQPGAREEPAPAAVGAGIPVNDPLVIAKCASCHTRDSQGNMQRISWERATPEGWQEALKRMILSDGVALTPAEARSIVKYLSADHGLAPEEAEPIMYDAERRIHQETNIPNDQVQHACARCHTFAQALAWRRSADDWNQLAEMHATRFKLPPNQEAIAFLAKVAPLHTPEWDAWAGRTRKQGLAGRWLVTASLRGHGRYYGEMQVEAAGDDEFTTTVRLTSVNDGSQIVRGGRSVVYAGYAWRGRSKGVQAASSSPGVAASGIAAPGVAASGIASPGVAAPDNEFSEAREVLWMTPDQNMAEGRWFWGQYQEFGFDVQLRRASDNPASGPALLMADRSSLKTGTEANRIRLIGDRFPARVTAADLDFGPGITVRRVVSSAASEVVAEVDVASDAALGKRDVVLLRSRLPGALAIYDRVDYIKVSPDSAMAAFSDQDHAPGYQKFEAIGYQRGPDGRMHTPDDVELGPLDALSGLGGVTWSLEVFYSNPGSKTDYVGKIDPSGFFTPSAASPSANFDVWVVATANALTAQNGKPLAGKSYMVVTVPIYTLNGRRYVRDLDRWVDDGPAQ